MLQKDFAYSEPNSVEPIYCSGIAHAHIDGANVHLAFFREQIAADGEIERVIVARLIMPESRIPAARQMTDFEITTSRERMRMQQETHEKMG